MKTIKVENRITGEILAQSDFKITDKKAKELTRKWNQDNPENKYYTC